MSGRPHVPTALKLLNGTVNTGRQNAHEPHLPPAIPDAPAHLNAEELTAWAMFGGLLQPMRVVTQADVTALELLATTYVHRARLAQALREASQLVYGAKKADGSVMLRTRPELTALADVDRRLLVLLGRFGLTPADRQKVVQMEDGGNPFNEFR